MDIETIRETVRRQPFEPFTLRMNDGREFFVGHPEHILLTRRCVVVVDHNTDVPISVEPLLIATMRTGRPGKDNGKKRQR